MRFSLIAPLALLAVPALALLAACQDEPTVAEKFNTIKSDVENKAQEYEAGAENLVAERERQLAEEGNILFQQNANLFGNAAEVEVDVNSGDVSLDARR